MDPWQIMIVDDHPLVREGIKGLIANEADLCVSSEASGVREALAQLRHSLPDLAIIDLALGDGDGLDLIRRFRHQAPQLKMLVVSMRDERLFAERAIQAGALGFINKESALEQLIAAVRQTLQGRCTLSAALTERLGQQIGARKRPTGYSAFERLTNRELEVLRFIGQGRSTREIAGSLHLSVKTIETHRSKLKRKLGVQSSAELVRQAVQWELAQT